MDRELFKAPPSEEENIETLVAGMRYLHAFTANKPDELEEMLDDGVDYDFTRVSKNVAEEPVYLSGKDAVMEAYRKAIGASSRFSFRTISIEANGPNAQLNCNVVESKQQERFHMNTNELLVLGADGKIANITACNTLDAVYSDTN